MTEPIVEVLFVVAAASQRERQNVHILGVAVVAGAEDGAEGLEVGSGAVGTTCRGCGTTECIAVQYYS